MKAVKKISVIVWFLCVGASDLCSETCYHDNLDYGVPSTNCDQIINRQGYSVGFSAKYLQPIWVSYRLTDLEVTNAVQTVRTNDFRPDPEIIGGSSTIEDYSHSGYDRGHLAPAADMSWSAMAMSESFLMSNMSPQKPDLNRGIWKDIETWVRRQAVANGSVIVVTGPIFDENSTNFIGQGRIRVPSGYYKVILDEGSRPKMIAFAVTNEGSTNKMQKFVCSVGAVEKMTGLTFFTKIPVPMAENMKKRAEFADWK